MVLVHGGAGDMEASREADAVAGCERAAAAGFAALESGAGALDAVCAAVRVLEENPLYNAGIGSVLTSEGDVEIDAAVMEGTGLRAGAVAALPRGRNGVELARAVLEAGEHVVLSGPSAWEFLESRGMAPAPLEELITERSRRRHAEERARRSRGLGGELVPGTVGAVAVDGAGRVAAATSTGGVNYKRPGRIGDTPLFGCGTLADDRGGAASATGKGEDIIRITMAAVAVAAMIDGTAADAAAAAVAALDRIGGRAGIITVDRHGGIGIAHNTATMPIAWLRRGGSGSGCRH